jgi:hypothetical protein
MIMSMTEFVSRFAAKDEKSFLFEILHRLGGLDLQAVQDVSPSGWMEWPPADDGGASLRTANA